LYRLPADNLLDVKVFQVMILTIGFFIWLFLIFLIVAFFRGSDLRLPSDELGGAPETQRDHAEPELEEWRRRRRDAG